MAPTSPPPTDASRVPTETLGDVLYTEPPPPHVHEKEWRALVDAVAARDVGALLEIYERSHRAVFTLLVRMTYSRELAEQLTAEVYSALYRTAPQWPPENTQVLTWILWRARSLALGRMRSDRRTNRARHNGDHGPFAFDMPDYRKVLQLRSLERSLGAALSTLAPDERRIVEAIYFDGWTYREAADALGLPPGEVSAALRRAVCELARHLSPRADLRANACPQAEMACALAVGALSADEVDGARSHLTSCGHCTRELETLQEVVDALVAWPTDVLRPRDAVWWRVLERVGAPASVGPPHARGPAWRSVAPGISCCVLTADTETQCVGMLVRLTPGGAYPPHVHASVEELYLLSGELWIDEEKVHPGDYHRSEPGTRDHRVWSETGCTCVLITSTRDALGAP